MTPGFQGSQAYPTSVTKLASGTQTEEWASKTHSEHIGLNTMGERGDMFRPSISEKFTKRRSRREGGERNQFSQFVF